MGFEREGFLGGYGSWPRRLLRLGHVSFYALGVLNILFALSVSRVAVSDGWLMLASWSLMAGAVLMPACCFASAWRKGWARAFALPVMLLVTGGTVVWVGMVLGVVGEMGGGAR